MKRIEKIYHYLEENTRKLSKEDLLQGGGFTPVYIADELVMLRNNVSKELNELLREGRIIKIKERPVRFIHRGAAEEILGIAVEDRFAEVKSIKEVFVRNEKKDPFKLLIGSEKSLKNQIEQAKAAILYPPNGLNTLIVGQTGVGKTLFAKIMYNYGKYIERFSEKSPFIVFNCADYYNNSQLLLSHIFGHVKGAFTGADSEKQGLVEKADGGILFLDEIHRLPPEGQEMIFYFMDTGEYNKLGETERTRKAKVLIIGATTEDADSCMLKTFMRRIPITINIPSLKERTNEEKVEIITHMFLSEAHRISKPVKASPEVVKALIGSATFGNIGQLKSNIQLTCAKGFLNSMSSECETIELDFKALPPSIKDGFFEIGRDRREFQQLQDIINKPLVINPDGYKVIADVGDSYEPPFNLYKIIEEKLVLLKEEGMDDDYINKFITTDVNIHIKSFYNKFTRNSENKERFLKIVDKETLEFAENVKKFVEKELERKYSDRFVYAFSLHISAFLKRVKENKHDKRQKYSAGSEGDKEYSIALKIRDMITENFDVPVPEVEVSYIAILLKSIEEDKGGDVGIIVAAHGNSTASSMVNVAKSLLGNCNLCAVDMPLNVSPKEILEIITNKVREINGGRGVLLLVDMGSLVKFDAEIIERTGIQVRSIDMVSTPLVLEAVRKSSLLDKDLDDIYNSLKDFRGYSSYQQGKKYSGNKVIVTVCSSGKGTAEKLKEMVEKLVCQMTGENINIVASGVKELNKTISELKNKNDILAVIGVKKPSENIPFISLEKLMDVNGEKILKDILSNNSLEIISEDNGIIIKDLCENSLREFLTYLNPHKVTGVLMEFVKEIETDMKTNFNNGFRIAVINHTAFALERTLTNQGFIYEADKRASDKEIFYSVDNASRLFKKALNISLSEDEKYYICDLLSAKVSESNN